MGLHQNELLSFCCVRFGIKLPWKPGRFQA